MMGKCVENGHNARFEISAGAANLDIWREGTKSKNIFAFFNQFTRDERRLG